MSTFTAEGFFDFVKAQTRTEEGANKTINNRTWETCAVGDYVRSVDPGWHGRSEANKDDIPKGLKYDLLWEAKAIYYSLNSGDYDTYGYLAIDLEEQGL